MATRRYWWTVCMTIAAWAGCTQSDWEKSGPGTNRSGPTLTKLAQKDREEADKSAYYQLVILSEPAPQAAPPGMKNVRLQNAHARGVAEIINILIIPAGPSGTEHRYTLIYPTREEYQLAEKWANELDVPPIKDIKNISANEPFRTGIGILQNVRNESDYAQRGASQRLAAEQLGKCLQDGRPSAEVRWAAGLLAGELWANVFYDYGRAEQVYQLTENLAAPGSYAQMAVWYARARAHLQNGRAEQARPILANLITQFSVYRECEIYARAMKTLARLEEKK